MIVGDNHTLIYGGPLAVGEVITSSVKNRLRMPVFATFPKGEGLEAALRSSNKLLDKRELADKVTNRAVVQSNDTRPTISPEIVRGY